MHVSRFSHTWFIYNLNTTFIRCEHTCAVIHTRTALHEYRSISQSSHLAPFLCPLPVPFVWWTTLFTYLEIPLLVIVVRMSNHARPWLVIDCPPLAPYPPPPLPTAPKVHVTCFQRRHHNISYIVWCTDLQLNMDTFKILGQCNDKDIKLDQSENGVGGTRLQ